MKPDELLKYCEQIRVVLKVEDSKVRAYGKASAVAQILPMLKAYKEEIKSILAMQEVQPIGSNFDHIACSYNERAAIMGYDGGLSKGEAERLAYQEVLKIFIKHYYPAIEAEFKAIIYYKEEVLCAK